MLQSNELCPKSNRFSRLFKEFITLIRIFMFNQTSPHNLQKREVLEICRRRLADLCNYCWILAQNTDDSNSGRNG